MAFVIYAYFKVIPEKVDETQTMTNNLQKNTKSIQIVDMGVRSYVVMMMNTENQFRYVEEKMLFLNSWKICQNGINK